MRDRASFLLFIVLYVFSCVNFRTFTFPLNVGKKLQFVSVAFPGPFY